MSDTPLASWDEIERAIVARAGPRKETTWENSPQWADFIRTNYPREWVLCQIPGHAYKLSYDLYEQIGNAQGDAFMTVGSIRELIRLLERNPARRNFIAARMNIKALRAVEKATHNDALRRGVILPEIERRMAAHTDMASMEVARLGSRAYNDVTQHIAQYVSSAVTPKRPLRLFAASAGRSTTPITRAQRLEELYRQATAALAEATADPTVAIRNMRRIVGAIKELHESVAGT